MSEIISESIEEIEEAHPLVDITPELEAATDHADLVLQGTIDTVDGMEGHSLTAAQKYLNSVLYAAGDIPASVHGNESVLTTVKGWFGKALEAIKRALSAVWNYFFGKSSPEKEVELLRNNIKLSITHVNEFKAKAKTRSGSSSTSSDVVIHLANNYEKAAEEVRAEQPALAKEYETAAEKLKENPVITSASDSRFVRDERLYKKMMAIAAAADAYNDSKKDEYEKVYDEVNQDNLFDNVSAFAYGKYSIAPNIKDIKSPDDVVKVLSWLDGQLNKFGLNRTMSIMKRNKTKTEGQIKELEKMANAGNKEEWIRKEITGLQKIVKLMKTWISQMEAQLNAMARLVKMAPKLYRLPA